MDLVERYCPKCGAACLASEAACGACGTSLKITRQLDEDDLFTPSTLRLAEHLHTRQLFYERYLIIGQVGVGGFGAVYEAEDTLEQRRVAIKEISLAGLSAQQMIEATGSFNREVEMLSSLEHFGIPRMYEQLTDAEHWYLVMEFIAGETLEERLARADDGRLPLEQALHIGEQMCAILSYLHKQQPPVIFRDIKPANIMLTSEEKLYLIDFGAARRYKPDKLRDTIAFGSPGYASPEQYGRAQTTPRADIYSLGALLHQMLSGFDPSLNPFHFQPLRACNRSVSGSLEKLVARMLADDREQRPATIDEVGRQLKNIRASLALAQQRKLPQAQSAATSANAAAPIFSTIGVTVFIYREHLGSVYALAWSPDGRALASTDDQWYLHVWQAFHHPSPRIAGPAAAQCRDLAWSPDGRVLALADEDHVVRLWRLSPRPHWWSIAAITLGYLSHLYEGHTSPVEHLCWSPDGQMIASTETKGAIHIWHARTRACQLVYQGHSNIVEDLAWSPDGTRIASCGLDRLVRIWSTADGDGRWKWRPKDGVIVHALAWSPDSRYLACGGSDRRIHVWDILHNHQVHVYSRHGGSIRSLAWSPDGQRLASADASGTVHVWSALDGKDTFIYRGHRKSVEVVSWSPDGLHLASAGEDAEVHIWKSL